MRLADISSVKTVRFKLGIEPREYGSWVYIPGLIETFEQPPTVIVDRKNDLNAATDVPMAPYKLILDVMEGMYTVTSFALMNPYTSSGNGNTRVSIVDANNPS